MRALAPLLSALLLSALLLAACATTPDATRATLPAAHRAASSPATTGAHRPPALSGDTSSAPPAVPFDKHAHSVTRADSIWVIVNKKHPLDPVTYHPDLTIVDGHYVDLRMAPHLTRLLAGSAQAGTALRVVSSYRSYDYQHTVFFGLVAKEGVAEAQRWSARPGYSEHQTGLAADLDLTDDPSCELAACFASTPGGEWLAANAWRYGFIVRYTRANSKLTGYDPEPWHVRYVGRLLAGELRRVHATSLEAFFGVTGGGYAS